MPPKPLSDVSTLGSLGTAANKVQLDKRMQNVTDSTCAIKPRPIQ